MKTAKDQRAIVSFFEKPSKKVRDYAKEDEFSLIVESFEKNTTPDDKSCKIQGPEKSNDCESAQKECEAKGNVNSQFPLQEGMFYQQKYNETENPKGSEDESLISKARRKS